MIVLLVGEGHVLADDSDAGELSELSARLRAAAELDDEIGVRSALAELSARVRSLGSPVMAAGVRGVDLIVPPESATVEEVRRLLVARPPSQAGSAGPELVVRTRRSDHRFHGGATYRIGRDPASDIVLIDSRVSWLHATLQMDEGIWILADAGSTNGIFLGPRWVDRVEIRAGCVVRLGDPDDGPLLRCMPQPQETTPDRTTLAPAPAPARGSPQPSAPAQAPGSGPAPAPAPGYGSTGAAAPVLPPHAESGRAPAAPYHQLPAPRKWWEPAPSREPGPPASSSPDTRPGVSGAAPAALDESGGYDDMVRRAFAELVQPGRLMFNPPRQMQLSQTERVEVRLTRTLTLDAELTEHLRGSGEPQLEQIPAAPLMAVTLKGDGFRITPYSDEEQFVAQDGITTWEFDVRALKGGQQRLVMCVSLRIPVAGQPLEHKSIPVREATIDVQVGVPALVGNFVAANWQWFIGTAVAIIAVVVAVIYH